MVDLRDKSYLEHNPCIRSDLTLLRLLKEVQGICGGWHSKLASFCPLLYSLPNLPDPCQKAKTLLVILTDSIHGSVLVGEMCILKIGL
jgi:hypothetical protein